jgi:hypothetical protein
LKQPSSIQNYNDWDRYEAEEKGEAAPKRAVRSNREIFNEEINIARIADETGFDSVWTIEHDFTPYTIYDDHKPAAISDLHSRSVLRRSIENTLTKIACDAAKLSTHSQ